MKYLFDTDGEGVLPSLAWSRLLVAFDFDGTLAPIVADREAAFMRTSTSDLLARVCEGYACAVISGRSVADVGARLKGANVKYVIGNHGLEPGSNLVEFEEQVALARPLLELAALSIPGVDIEDKTYSIAVHFRASRSKRRAKAAMLAAIAGLPFGMRTVHGKLVVNVVPAQAPNKGDALLDLRAREAADIALYVGDDVTDEDVFQLDQPGRLLTIRVGEARHSSATYFLRNQREIDRLLRKLASLGEGARRSTEGPPAHGDPGT